jgi:hypothetical protein
MNIQAPWKTGSRREDAASIRPSRPADGTDATGPFKTPGCMGG